MEFIGEDGVPAPRLKDATMTEESFAKAYLETLKLIRDMFHNCRLVHADLSEYNLLYFREQVWIIDVSQAVEHDHPMALEFLRRDVFNINQFFEKNKVYTLNTKYAFEFVTELQLEAKDPTEEIFLLRGKMEKELSAMTEEEKQKMEVDEKVFQQIFIPRTIAECSLEELE